MPERQLDRVERRLDTVEERLDGVESRLDRVDERMDGVESRLDRLDERLDALSADVSIVKTDVAELKADSQILKADVADLKADVRSLHHAAIRHESMHDELRLVADAVVSLGERMERGFREVREEMQALAAPIHELLAAHTTQLQDHARRISSLE